MDTQAEPGFDVWVKRSIGRITYDALSNQSGPQAAMALIARDFDPGEYEFPLPWGGTARVVVEYDPPDSQEVEIR